MGLPYYPAMLAVAGDLPADDSRWGYEVKFDGIRAIGYVDQRLRLQSRNGKDITVAWPELAELAAADPPYVVDGEIVTFDAGGRTSFEALQPRMHQRNAAAIRSLTRTVPATYIIFDLLHIGNRTLTKLPYIERRGWLEQLNLRGPSWQVPRQLDGPGAKILDASKSLGLEGIICKRLDSPYLPGKRSSLWIKVKNIREQEVIVVGWRSGSGRRAGTIGSLLMAVHDPAGQLVYVGNVGTGFTERSLDELRARMLPLQRAEPTITVNVPGATWVEPELVGEVSFTEWTGDGRLRHPSWRGLRSDKEPAEITMPK